MHERLTRPECITSFPATFDADFMALDEPGSSSVASVSTTDPSIANTVELDGWDSGKVIPRDVRADWRAG